MDARVIFTGFGAKAAVNERSILRRVRAPERSSQRQQKKIYLTFDDGPDGVGTPRVLDVLSKRQAKATFFVIAEKARANAELLKRIQSEGHAIGNHSLNHRYGHFFSAPAAMEDWIRQAGEILKATGIEESVGFRPPAGLCTPPLFASLKALDEPLILWSHRFFDTKLTWTEKRMREVLPQLRDGDILLLHDRQSRSKIEEFCVTLDLLIVEAARLGFECDRLTRELSQRQRLAQQQIIKGV